MLFILFAVTVSNITGQIEKDILKEYGGTVMVKFKSENGVLEVVKREDKILISSFSTDPVGNRMRPLNFGRVDREGIESGILRRNRRNLSTRIPIAYYDGEKFSGLMKEYFISYIIFGCRCGYLYSLEKIKEDGVNLIGTNRNGLYVEFDRGSRLPKVIEFGDMKLTINKWTDVDGFGMLPGETNIWIDDEKVDSRTIEDISNPKLGSAFFESNRVKKPVILE